MKIQYLNSKLDKDNNIQRKITLEFHKEETAIELTNSMISNKTYTLEGYKWKIEEVRWITAINTGTLKLSLTMTIDTTIN